MRNVIVALGSFIVGALCMFLLGNHTSPLPQSVFAQVPSAVHAAAAIPVVPNVILGPSEYLTVGAGAAMELDGNDCRNCALLNGATVRYSGGPFRFENLQRSGAINIELKGAALNTGTFLQLFGLIGCPTKAPKQEPPNPNRMLKSATFQKDRIEKFASPVGIKE